VHAADMTANKNNYVVGIVFIYTGGSNFIQVVNCVTDLTAADAATEGKKIQNLIKNSNSCRKTERRPCRARRES
jgi:hypothetical protein